MRFFFGFMVESDNTSGEKPQVPPAGVPVTPPAPIALPPPPSIRRRIEQRLQSLTVYQRWILGLLSGGGVFALAFGIPANMLLPVIMKIGYCIALLVCCVAFILVIVEFIKIKAVQIAATILGTVGTIVLQLLPWGINPLTWIPKSSPLPPVVSTHTSHLKPHKTPPPKPRAFRTPTIAHVPITIHIETPTPAGPVTLLSPLPTATATPRTKPRRLLTTKPKAMLISPSPTSSPTMLLSSHPSVMPTTAPTTALTTQPSPSTTQAHSEMEIQLQDTRWIPLYDQPTIKGMDAIKELRQYMEMMKRDTNAKGVLLSELVNTEKSMVGTPSEGIDWLYAFREIMKDHTTVSNVQTIQLPNTPWYYYNLTGEVRERFYTNYRFDIP